VLRIHETVAANNDPCAHAILSGAKVDARQQIATAQAYIAAGKAAANASPNANPLFSFLAGWRTVELCGWTINGHE
jgi:hypothetical protein